MKQLYLKLKEQLDLITEIKHVHIFNSQFENLENELPFPFPCVFIDVCKDDGVYTDVSNRVQKLDTVVTIHLGYTNYNDNPFDVFDIETEIYKKLQGYRYEDTTIPMKRINIRINKNYSNIYVLEIDYYTQIQDTSLKPATVSTTVGLDTTYQIVKTIE